MKDGTIAGMHRHDEVPATVGQRGRHDQHHAHRHQSPEAAMQPVQSAPAPRNGEDDHGDQGKQRQREGPRAGVVNHADPWQPEVDRVGRWSRELGEVGLSEGAGEREGVVAHLLHAARIEVKHVIGGAVVVLEPVDHREVQRGHRAVLAPEEDAEVGIVGEQTVDGCGEGVGEGRGSGPGHRAHQRRIAGAGLEEIDGTPIAAAVEVEHHLHVLRQSVQVRECLGAEESAFLGVGEEHHEVVGDRRVAKGADGLEDRGHAGSIVAGSRCAGDGVVMRHQQERAGGMAPGAAGHDVPHHGCAWHVAEAVEAGGALHLDREAEFAEPVGEEHEDCLMLLAAHGVGGLGDRAEFAEGALSREDAGGCPGRDHGWRAQGRHAEPAAGDQDRQGTDLPEPAHLRKVLPLRHLRYGGGAPRPPSGGGPPRPPPGGKGSGSLPSRSSLARWSGSR